MNFSYHSYICEFIGGYILKKYLLLFLVTLFILSGCSQDKEDSKEEDKEKTEPVVEKEAIDVELMNSSFNKEDGTIEMSITTDDIPEDTVVHGRALIGDIENDIIDRIFIGESKIKDGKADIIITPEDEDEYLANTTIPNGDYDLSLIVRLYQEDDLNLHLLDSWGDYAQFESEYEYDGTLRKDDDGDYLALFQFEDTLDVTESISLEEAKDIDDKIEEDKEKAEEEEERLEEEQRLKEEKAEYKELDFKQLDKNPDKHSGELVKYSGRIVQIIEGESSSDIRLGLGEYGSDVIYIYFDDVTEFVEDDNITVYGEVVGSYTYDTAVGGQMTVPLISADIIE